MLYRDSCGASETEHVGHLEKLIKQLSQKT